MFNHFTIIVQCKSYKTCKILASFLLFFLILCSLCTTAGFLCDALIGCSCTVCITPDKERTSRSFPHGKACVANNNIIGTPRRNELIFQPEAKLLGRLLSLSGDLHLPVALSKHGTFPKHRSPLNTINNKVTKRSVIADNTRACYLSSFVLLESQECCSFLIVELIQLSDHINISRLALRNSGAKTVQGQTCFLKMAFS